MAGFGEGGDGVDDVDTTGEEVRGIDEGLTARDRSGAVGTEEENSLLASEVPLMRGGGGLTRAGAGVVEVASGLMDWDKRRMSEETGGGRSRERDDELLAVSLSLSPSASLL